MDTLHAPLVVCLGDLAEDIVVRLAEGPRRGTDAAASITRRRGGSAANVAVSVVASGGRARFVGAIGSDPVGQTLVDELLAQGVETSVERLGRNATIVVIVDPTGQRSFLSDRGGAGELSVLPADALQGAVVLHIPAYSFDGGPLSTVAKEAMRLARLAGITVSVDASSVAVLERLSSNFWHEIRPDVLFANIDEADVLQLPRADLGLTVIKAGAEPTRLYDGDLLLATVLPPQLRAVADTTGAGDAFAGGFLAWLARDQNPVKALTGGHNAAARHLRSLGTR